MVFQFEDGFIVREFEVSNFLKFSQNAPSPQCVTLYNHALIGCDISSRTSEYPYYKSPILPMEVRTRARRVNSNAKVSKKMEKTLAYEACIQASTSLPLPSNDFPFASQLALKLEF
jgi:hypothetical protein